MAKILSLILTAIVAHLTASLGLVRVLADATDWMLMAVVAAALMLTHTILGRPHRKHYARLVARKNVAEHVARAPALVTKSAREIAAGVLRGEWTAEEVMRTFTAHAAEVNELTNSLVGTRYEEAIAEARALDRLSAAEKRRLPLLGVPFVSKECFEFEGMPYTSGLVQRKGLLGQNTCEQIQRLIDAGAVCVGVGNLSEACMWMESSNKVHGTTNNPYDLSRTVGGSSGGNSSAVAACAAPFAITSDVGGSTRIPGGWNGVFGHKPTGRAVSNTDTIPLVHGKINAFCQLGPTARYAEDLMPILKVIAGPCETDDFGGEEFATRDDLIEQWADPEDVDVGQLHVVDVRDQPSSVQFGFAVYDREPWFVDAHDRVVECLHQVYGCPVVPARFPLMDKAFDIWAATLGTHAAPFRGIIAEGKGSPKPFLELLWWLATFGYGGDHTLPALGLANVERLTELTPAVNEALMAEGEELKAQISRALGDDGIMIFPNLPTVAPEHGPLPFLLRAGESGATGILNVLEFPCTSVPLGLCDDLGLPVSVQIVANHGRDDLCIAAAVALERAGVARWTPPRPAR